jgi:hypothetical protein
VNKRSVRAVAGIGAVALALVGITANVSFADEAAPVATVAPADAAAAQADGFVGGRLEVPEALVPPEGNKLDSVFKAHGVQIYGCGTGTWALIEPAASLTGITLDPVRRVSAIHFRGPSWESDMDGTLVVGKAPPKSAPSATPNSIPQLLVTAAETRGAGTFGGVTFIQRLATVGGIAPTRTCTAADTEAVRYSAVYRFFKKG